MVNENSKNSNNGKSSSRNIVIWCSVGKKELFDSIAQIYIQSVDSTVSFEVEEKDDVQMRSQLSVYSSLSILPDIIIPDDPSEFIENYPHLFMDLNNYLDVNSLVASESAIQKFTDEYGCLYGFPIFSEVAAFYYNKKIFSEYEYDFSSEDFDLEKFVKTAQSIRDISSGSKYLIAYTNSWAPIYLQATGDIFSDQSSNIDFDKAREFFELLQYLRDNNLMYCGEYSNETVSISEYLSLLASGRVCAAIGGPYWIGLIKDMVEKDCPDYDSWGVVPIPKSQSFMYDVSLYDAGCIIIDKFDEEKREIVLNFLLQMFTENADVVRLIVQKNYVPVSLFALSKLSEYDNSEFFDVNVIAFLSDRLDNIPVLEYGNNSKELANNFLTLSNDVALGYATANTAFENLTDTYTPEPIKRFIKLEIITPPRVTEYYKYEKFSIYGMEVAGYYADGSWEYVNQYYYEPNMFLSAEIDRVKVFYKTGSSEIYTYQPVTVKDRHAVGIRIVKNRTVYLQGDTLTDNDFIVIVQYNEGQDREVIGSIVSHNYLDSVGEKTVTVSYSEDGRSFSGTITINVLRKLMNIAIVKKPKKMMYYGNERFDRTEMVVQAEYSDNSTMSIPLGRLDISPKVLRFKSGETSTSVTVGYTENGITKSQALTVYKKTGREANDCDIKQDFGACGYGSVNASSGSITYTFIDFNCTDTLSPLDLVRTYKREAENLGLGNGWRFNMQQELAFSSSFWKYTDGNGKVYDFNYGYSNEDGRSAIRNEKLGLDLFSDDNVVTLVNRSNNIMAFKKICGVYRLTEIHLYPSTPEKPIDAYCTFIEYNDLNGYISNIKWGLTVNGKRRKLRFEYENGLLASLIYEFTKETVVAEYAYNDNKLISVKRTNANTDSAYSSSTVFSQTETEFAVYDKSSENPSGINGCLKYTLSADERVSNISIGYGADESENSEIEYTGRLTKRSDGDPETDIVMSCRAEQNGIASITSFNSLCVAASYSYELGENGSYYKPKRILSATSRGFDYISLANKYSDTLDVCHDDFEDDLCGWSGGMLTAEKCVCGTESLTNTDGGTLEKTYTFHTSDPDGTTLYLSLWALAKSGIEINVKIEGARGTGEFTHALDGHLNNKWQFTAFGLGRVSNGERITVTVRGAGLCLDDIRLTKAPYETPDDIAENTYDPFGNIENEYVYDPIDKKVVCNEYFYNDGQLTRKRVSVDNKTIANTLRSYDNGFLSAVKEYGIGAEHTEEKYTVNSSGVIEKTVDKNDVTAVYSFGADWSQYTLKGGTGCADVTVKNTCYKDSDFIKQVASLDYVNNLKYNSFGALGSSAFGTVLHTGSDQKIELFYDTFGNVNKVKIGTVALETYDYDYKHLNKIMYADNSCTQFAYDKFDRVTQIKENDGYTADFVYSDDAENTVTVTDTVGITYTSKNVNKNGKTSVYTAEFEGETQKLEAVSLALNGSGNITAIEIYTDSGTNPFESVKTVTDSLGLLKKIERTKHGFYSEYEYDGNYRLKIKTVRLQNVDVTSEYVYKAASNNRIFNQISEEKFSRGSIQAGDTFKYVYGANGCITCVTANDSPLYDYEYDGYGRIEKEYNYAFGEMYEYTYDVCGNRTSKKTYKISNGAVSSVPDKTDVYSYDNIIADCGQNSAWHDQLKSINGTPIKYDGSGNPILYKGKTLAWNNRKLTEADGIRMSYDYKGLRVKKGNKKYYWQDTDLRMESENGKFIYYFYDETGVCGMHYDGSDYYFRKNLLGDIVALYDNTCALICKYVYDAYGNHKITDGNGNEIQDDGSTIGSINPFRYRGYYWDRELKLYYLKSRYYDPEAGRFISPDSSNYLDPESISGMNLYAYCGNNPIMYIDPSGKFAWLILFFVAGIIIGGIIGGSISYAKGNRGWDVVKDILLGSAVGFATFGAGLALVGVLLGATIGIGFTIAGVTAAQMFAIGAVAFNAFAWLVSPIIGLEIQGIEYEAPKPKDIKAPQPTPPHPYK